MVHSHGVVIDLDGVFFLCASTESSSGAKSWKVSLCSDRSLALGKGLVQRRHVAARCL